MKTNYPLVLLIFLVFFVISFLTNILGPIIPDIIESFNLNLTLVAFLPFSFFVAYGFMSIPSGMAIERYGEKPVLIIAFAVAFAGALAFALFPSYGVSMASLFTIGAGMAMLQVVLNPLLRVAGGGAQYAFNMVLAQLVFGSASFLSPMVYSYLVTRLGTPAAEGDPFLRMLSRVVPPDLSWVSIYWIFAVISLVMLVVMVFLRLPRVELTEEEKVGAWATSRMLLGKRTILLYFLGLFAYVGSEQGVANWISKFLSIYHGFDPHVEGAKAVSWYWGLFTAGTMLGLVLVKLFDSRKVVVGFAAAAMITLAAALFGPAEVSYRAFPLVGFFTSSLFSLIFSLALNSVDRHHGAFSGILCTGIVGGAVVPLIIGGLGDLFGLRWGMLFLYLTFGYMLSIGIWARPLVMNETIPLPWNRKEPGKQPS